MSGNLVEDCKISYTYYKYLYNVIYYVMIYDSIIIQNTNECKI